MLFEMKDFARRRPGTVVGIGQHEILHMRPPAPTDFRQQSAATTLRTDLGVAKIDQPCDRENSVTVNAVCPEHLLQLGPDRIVTPFVFVLIARPETHQERFANHVTFLICDFLIFDFGSLSFEL